MKKITFILFALFTCWQINAQVTSYAFSQSNGTYTALSAPTILANQTATSGTSAGALDDVNYTLALPFNFNFAGVNYVSGANIFVNSNGFVSFGPTAPTEGTYGPIGSTNAYNGALSAFGLDANGGYGALGSNTTGSAVITITSGNTSEFTVGALISGTGVPVGSTVVSVNATQVTISGNCTSTGTGRTFHVATGQISYGVEGVSPNRKLIIQYTNLRPYNVTQSNLDFQIVLNETSNVIEFIYGSSISGTTSSAPQVGLRGSANTSYLNRTSTTSWSSTTAGTTNTQTISFLDTVLPSSGLTFTWFPPSCAAPAGFVASALTATTATIAWNAASPVPSTGYEYYYSSINTAPSAAGTPTSNLTENLTGLSVNTPYYVWLRSDCGGGTFSAWAGPFTFATPCNPYSVPYFEGFESGYTHNVAVAGCISQATLTGTQVWTANSTFTDRNRTPRTGSFNAFLQYSNEDWMFIPIDLVGGTSYRVSLYARQDGATAANSNIAISYGTANNNAAMTNAIVAATGIIDGTYQEIVGDFVPSTSGTYYVGIKGFMNGTPWYISLDDISITESPSCLNPTSIIASNITSNSVDLSWTDGSGGLQFDYEYAIQAPGTGVPASAGAQVGDVTIAGEGFDINGDPLAANTLYEVYVRSDCGGGDFSPWVGPITFTTSCVADNLPYTQNFESATVPALPSCTSQQNVGSGNLWTVQNNPGYGFTTKALRYAWNSSNAANVWFYTNGINLVGGTTYKITYDYGGTGTFFPEKLKVAYGNSANVAAMTNLLADHPNVTSATPVNNFVDFTPATSGVYYFGFNAYSIADQFYLFIDNIVVDLALSNADFDNSNFSAYPNPVKDVLNISYTSEISSVRVINMIGQEVLSKNINATSSQVDMSQLSAGTYIINVTVGDAIKTLKVVKQ
jgi:Secretion system C-terminal sorting domain